MAAASGFYASTTARAPTIATVGGTNFNAATTLDVWKVHD